MFHKCHQVTELLHMPFGGYVPWNCLNLRLIICDLAWYRLGSYNEMQSVQLLVLELCVLCQESWHEIN